MKSSSAVCSE